jgi:hypothetical protein
MTPRLSPDLHLEVRHGVEDNAFVPASYALSNGSRPFFSRLETEAWVVALLNEFDGVRMVREVAESAKARGRVPAGFSDADLVRIMCFLSERGCITAPNLPTLPAPPARPALPDH